jgi:hypothetical protein
MDELERRTRRLRRAHFLIRAELAIAFAVPLFAAFLYVAMPMGPSPMFAGEPPLIETLVPGSGVGLFLIGLVWMIRLSRPDPEAGERSWRYRDFD